MQCEVAADAWFEGGERGQLCAAVEWNVPWLGATLMFSMETGTDAVEWELYSESLDGARTAVWPWDTAVDLLCGRDPLEDVIRLAELRTETEDFASQVSAYASSLDLTEFRAAVERLERFLSSHAPSHAVTLLSEGA